VAGPGGVENKPTPRVFHANRTTETTMIDSPLPPALNGNGRHDGGRFATGNSFGKGNPQLKRMHALRRVLLDSVDDGSMREVAEKLTSLARGGDLDAIKILLSYTIGRPPQSIALTGPDGEALGMDWSAVQGTIMGALASFPEARLAVALKLKGMADDARGSGSTGDGSGPEFGDGGGGP
jgi:hypothetical protein